MENPSAESIKKRVEDLTGIVDWVAEIWHGKNWVRRLLLLDVLLFVAFNPYFQTVLKLIPDSFIPGRYNLYFWVVVGLCFVIALIIGVRAKSVRPAPPPPDRRSPIKGLLAFDTADEEVFARLQRHNELLECAQAITDHNFRFGILSADSGNGKTSFLQAGLAPALRKRDHRCVYVKFAELDPVASIRHALAGRFPPDTPPDATLSELLRSAARSEDKGTGPLVLLLDQFEQFFVHQKRKKDREPFIRQLSEWYNGDSTTPAKLLISIRRDFRGHLDEMQKAMGYSLGPQQIFNLERFTPEQAAEIFRVLAESAQMECDQGFLEEVTAQELAASDDGLISPVDIQILAWMITRQSAGEERAFTRRTSQKLGGVEGLLERFLTHALDARETPPRRQAATKALLALTDLERNTRAGALTLDDLRCKLGDTVTDSDLREAVEWLTRGDVRLAVPVKRDDVEGYELAHERLIPALRRIANKELTEADRANLLLDRRANEWQGSDRDKRYLFSWRELRLVSKQTTFLQWGQNRSVKQALLRASKRRLRLLLASGALPFLLAIGGALTWYSQWWQLRLIKWEVERLSQSLDDVEALGQVAKVYALTGEFSKARGVAEKIHPRDPKESAPALRGVAEAMADVGEKEQAIWLLRAALGEAERIRESEAKVSALKGIVKAAAEIREKVEAIEPLQQVREEAERIMENDAKESSLERIDTVRTYLGEKWVALELLQQAQEVSQRIRGNIIRARELRAIAVAVAEAGAEGRAQELLQQARGVAENIRANTFRAQDLEAIAGEMVEVGAKGRAQDLIQKAHRIAEKVTNELTFVLRDIAEAMVEIGAQQGNKELIQQALEGVVPGGYTPFALRDIAKAMAEAGAKRRNEGLIKQARVVAEEISDERQKSFALAEVAKAMAEVGAKGQAMDLIRQANVVAEKIVDKSSKSSAMTFIARAMAEVGAKVRAVELIRQAQGVAEKVPEKEKGAVLTVIAKAATVIGDFRFARAVASKQFDKAGELLMLALILETWERSKDPRLADKIWESEGSDEA